MSEYNTVIDKTLELVLAVTMLGYITYTVSSII